MFIKTSGLLTIIIPCYNAEKYINRCTSSLEGLNCDDITILFVNDGSKDSTKILIDKWIEQRTNAFIISKDNGGYSSAINEGLNNCGSEYVMFMGVDDELDSIGINTICSHLRDNHPDIIVFSTLRIFDDEHDINKCEKDILTNYKNQGFYKMDVFNIYEYLHNDSRILFIRDTSRCFKMSAIGEIRYFGKSGVSADGCFSSLVACQSRTFEFVNKCCYLWHLHKDSVSGRSRTLARVIDEAEVWGLFFKEIREKCIDIKIPSPIISHFFIYKRVISDLYKMNQYIIAKKHEANANIFLKWCFESHKLTLKSRLKLMFPSVYTLMVKILNNGRLIMKCCILLFQ